MKIGIIATETSADRLGAIFINALKTAFPQAEFIGVGGECMIAAGCHSLIPIESLTVMGFSEVLQQYLRLYRLRKRLIQALQQQKLDLLIGIDAPDFTLTIERIFHRMQVPTVHLVSPTVWAWRASRVKTVARSCNLLLCIYPFEPAYYANLPLRTAFIGHPLADQIPLCNDSQTARQALKYSPAQQPLIALLPGSRQGEIHHLGSVFLQAAQQLMRQHPQAHFLLAASSKARADELRHLLAQRALQPPQFRLFHGRTQQVITAADAVLLSSGTATLETLLIKRPMVVAYRTSALNYAIFSRLLRVPWIAQPNWLAGAKIVPELIQQQVTAENLCHALQRALEPQNIAHLMPIYTRIHHQLRKNAALQAIRHIAALIK